MQSLIDIRDSLYKSTFTQPPPSYKGRVICQIVLCSVLILQCCVHLAYWCRDAYRRKGSIRMIGMQRMKGGRIVTIQALGVYTVCALLTGVMVLIGRCLLYKNYFQYGDRQNSAIFGIICWTPASFGALAYTFSNFHAGLMLSRKSASFAHVGKIWIYAYNAVLGVAIIAWLVSIIPLAIEVNSKLNQIFRLVQQSIDLLDKVILDPSLFSSATLAQLQQWQSAVGNAAEVLGHRNKSSLIVGMTYSSFYALAGIFNLFFIRNLRKNYRKVQNELHRSGQLPSQISSMQVNQPWTFAKGAVTSAQDSQTAETAALERLIADLTLSVPVVLLLCIYYPITGGVAIRWGGRSGWHWEEYRNDLFSWPEICVNNLILAFFLYNQWAYPDRYGAHNQYTGSSSGSSASGRWEAYRLRLAHAPTGRMQEGGATTNAHDIVVPVTLNQAGGGGKE